MTKHNLGKGTDFMSTPKTNYPSDPTALLSKRTKRKGFTRTNDQAMADEHQKGKSGKGH